MLHLFQKHPASVGETYFEHMGMASSFGFKMLAAGMACMLHGLFPFLCVKTGSTAIAELHDRMVTNRHGAGAKANRGMVSAGGK
jgi:hypothetical protein